MSGHSGTAVSGESSSGPASPLAPPTRFRSGAGDVGAATIMVLGVLLLMCVAALVAAFALTLLTEHTRVAQAADLAALAGAERVWDGAGPACTEARRIAAAQGATLAACRTDGLDVQVTAELTPTLPAWLTNPGGRDSESPLVVTAQARAGPPDDWGG